MADALVPIGNTVRLLAAHGLSGLRIAAKRMQPLAHDPEKACQDVIRGGNRLLEKIMLHQGLRINDPIRADRIMVAGEPLREATEC